MAVSDRSSVGARRGPPPSLELDQILLAALRLLDRKGASAFSMRLLAAELGASTMTLYNYFPTKAALLDAVVDSVLEQIVSPSPDVDPWDEELRKYATRAWKVQAPHPWLSSLLVEQNVVDRPAQADARRALVALFLRVAGNEQSAREAVAAFFSFMIGSFMQAHPTATGRVSPRADALFSAGVDILIEGLKARFERTP
jgi:AcrR family transcriptional regulator